jgi:hypothetical protein
MRAIATLMVLAVLGSAPAAGAKPRPLADAGTYDSDVIADGERFAATRLREDQGALVWDDATGVRSVRPRPPYCFPLAAVGAGRLAWYCQDPERPADTVGVADLTSGELTAVQTPRGLPVQRLGERWLQFRSGGGRPPALAFVDWRTGEARNDDGDVHLAQSLDTADPLVPLCAPLRRRTTSAAARVSPAPVQQYDYNPPWGVTHASGHRFFQGPLLLERCGRRRPQTLSSCRALCSAPQLGGGWVTWYEFSRPNRVFGVRLRDRRRFEWAPPRAVSRRTVARVEHTRRRLYVSYTFPSRGDYQLRSAYVADLPR